MPIKPWNSGELDELYPSRKNLFCIFVHFVLVILQLCFILALPIAIFFPLWMSGLGIGALLLLNWAMCKLLNGKELIFHSEKKFARALPEHEHEQWVFVNGVAVG